MSRTAKVALVTGASRGVGAAVAVALASAGYAVACAARSTRAQPQRTPGTIDDVVDRIREGGGTAISIPVDLSDREQVTAMVERSVAELGRLDVLVNNAAVTFIGDLDLPLRRHDLIMAIDLDAPLVASRAAVPHLAQTGEGRILNVSSLAALAPFPGNMSYGIAKLGLERLTVDLARQLAPVGIAANVFRIDVPVASEGFVANTPTADHSGWEPSAVAAEGILWMLRQPVSYSGQLESMAHLAHREGIMASVAARPGLLPATEMFTGVMPAQRNIYASETEAS
jgi:citronellol/citronellal dehydrogenase